MQGPGAKRTPLCVLTPGVGGSSESFVRSHIEDLLPGQGCAISLHVVHNFGKPWSPSFPSLVLEPYFSGPMKYLWRLLRLTVLRRREREQILRFLKEHQVEAVLVEYAHIAATFADIIKESGVRCYAHGHGYDVSGMLRDPKMVKSYSKLNLYDAVIVVSQHSRNRLISIGIKPELISVIPCGSRFKGEYRERPRGETLRLLAVGRFTPKKAPLITLQAFANASKERPNMVLEMIGRGELLDKARAFVESNGLGDKVTLHGEGRHEFVQEKFAAADLFVQHSMTDPRSGDEEGLPVAVLEAMSVGLPVVATRHAGIPDAVVEGQTGLLVDEGDVAGMAAAIVKMYDSPERCAEFGKAGYERAITGFTFEVERERLLALMKFT